MATSTKVDFKVVLLGQERVGKTCIMQRWLYGRYREQSPTVGAAYGAKQMRSEKSPTGVFTLGLWDTAGSERYESMSRIYYKGAKAALICYDMTFSPSFKKVRFWADELRKMEPLCEIFIVGTKCDMITSGAAQPGVDKEELREFASQFEIDDSHIWETSAKTGAGVIDLFEAVAKEYKGPETHDPETVSPEAPKEEPADSELPGSVTEIDQNEEPVAEETDGMNLSADIDFDEKLEEPELDDVAISDDLDATIEDDISIPKVDDILEPPAEDDIVGEETPVTTDSLSSDNIDYLESEPASDEMPEKSMDIPDDFGMEEEPQDIVLEEPEQEEPVPTVESVTNDIPSEEADFTEPEISDADFGDDEPLPLAPEDLPADADEEAEANEPTDKVFESDQWNEPETAPVEEEPEFVPAEKPAPAADESHSVLEKANQIKGTMTSDLRDEIKSVLIYMDQLLENLPEDKIEEFAKSEYFETYKKLFKELGLS